MAKQVTKATFDKMVDVVLENSGTPRRRLFEYPYNQFESRDILAKATTAVNRILVLMGDDDK